MTDTTGLNLENPTSRFTNVTFWELVEPQVFSATRDRTSDRRVARLLVLESNIPPAALHVSFVIKLHLEKCGSHGPTAVS